VTERLCFVSLTSAKAKRGKKTNMKKAEKRMKHFIILSLFIDYLSKMVSSGNLAAR
jgi:hypothetical protein